MPIHVSDERFAFSTFIGTYAMYIHVKGDEGASGKGHDIDTMNLRQGVHFELLFNGAVQICCGQSWDLEPTNQQILLTASLIAKNVSVDVSNCYTT